MGDVGDNTDLLPSIVAARRLLHVLLSVLALGALGLAAILTLRPPMGAGVVTPETTAAIDAEAHRLPLIFDATAKSAHVQAETMAQGTQIRAGVMTDAATVKDLVTSEIQLPRNLDQTLELVQLRDAQRIVLLRMPDAAASVGVTHALETRFEVNGKKDLALVVGTAVAPFDNSANITGELVLSTPVDFAITRDALAAFTTRVALTGAGFTFPILSGPGDGGTVRKLPIALDATDRVAPLSLEITPRLSAAVAAWAGPARLIAFGAALVLAFVLGVSLYRNRDP